MSRFKRTTNRGNWSPEQMQIAIDKVNHDNMSIREAAERYNVPKSTLHERARSAREGDPVKLTAKLGRHETTFTQEQEQELKKYMLELDSYLMPVSKQEFLLLAYNMAERLQIPHRFNKEENKAGDSFYRGFMKRNPELSLRIPQSTSLNRCRGFNENAVETYFVKLIGLMEQNQFHSGRIYNVDETGISEVHKNSKVISIRGKNQVGKRTTAEKGTLVTTLICGSADGELLPPFFVFKKSSKKTMMEGAPSGSEAYLGKSGWVTSDAFLHWMYFFIEKVKPTAESPVLLLLDGHSSHKSIDVLEMAKAHFITILSLPPHCTHKLQPLDRAFMKSFKTKYNQEAEKFTRDNGGTKILQKDIASLVEKALKELNKNEKKRKNGETITVNIEYLLKTGFKCTGIHPFNREIFKNDPTLVKNKNEDEEEESTNPVRTALKEIMPLPVKHAEKRQREGVSEVLTATPSISQRQKRKRVSKN